MSVPDLPELADDELAQLEASVGAALASGSADGLTRLGHGEITLVLGWPVDRPAVACKRLPVVPDAAGAGRWGRLIGDYVEQLGERGAGPRNDTRAHDWFVCHVRLVGGNLIARSVLSDFGVGRPRAGERGAEAGAVPLETVRVA